MKLHLDFCTLWFDGEKFETFVLDKPAVDNGPVQERSTLCNDCKNETVGLSTLPCVRTGMGKDFLAFGVALVRRMTAATAAC